MLYYILTSNYSLHDIVATDGFEPAATLAAEDFSDKSEFCIICEDGNFKHYRISYETNWMGFVKTHITEIQKPINIAQLICPSEREKPK